MSRRPPRKSRTCLSLKNTKPVQDALQSIVFFNDRQVRDLRGGRRDIDLAYRLRFMSLTLMAAFADGRPFVHIRVWRSPVTMELG